MRVDIGQGAFELDFALDAQFDAYCVSHVALTSVPKDFSKSACISQDNSV